MPRATTLRRRTHHDIAEIVQSEVESAQPDGHDQQGGAQHHSDLPAAPVDPEQREHVGEHCHSR